MSSEYPGARHIDSRLMRESLVDKQVLDNTHTPIRAILPKLNVIQIGGLSIMDKGKSALLPVLDEIIANQDKHVQVTCPWGNRMRCYAPGPEWGELTLGMVYVEFDVKPGDAEGIQRFYETVLGAPASVVPEAAGTAARVRIGGQRQELIFRETAEEIPPYDGHHIAVYIANFSGPHAFLKQHGLVTEESSEIQYRFQDIVDPETRRPLFTIEHEVRCLTHPMFLRPLVNRNPGQRQATYQRGRDAFVPGMS